MIAATTEIAKIFARDTSELLPCIELNVIELGSFRYALGYLRRIFTARLHNFWGSRPRWWARVMMRRDRERRSTGRMRAKLTLA